MPPKKATAKKSEPKVDPLVQELADAKQKIQDTPQTAEFRQARKYLIMYAREIQDILTARK